MCLIVATIATMNRYLPHAVSAVYVVRTQWQPMLIVGLKPKINCIALAGWMWDVVSLWCWCMSLIGFMLYDATCLPIHTVVDDICCKHWMKSFSGND